ncbi:MAG: hypothetical protein J7K57_06860 [Palaeococcus sp.]|uniref:hypothetical protein n=1 Tax=Palaeococcus sp. (in: euryarchaeotes) TaxID=2820298 RepID=UPI0025D93ADD|nr:hypothetical protein [Palaeococcus sp. (in: euryarchaeotes)]MCD6559572.1 hypothetical protein [Palaeococcus sp. (in: euryarchaeotes)]
MVRLWKSKEEKEIERRVRMRKAKMALKQYINNLEGLKRKIFLQGKEAAKLGDEALLKRSAVKYLALEQRIKQAKRLLLLMEEAEIQRELVKISTNFIQFSKDVVESIAEGPGAEDVAKIQVKFEKAMGKVENIEEALNTMIDLTSESILTGNFDMETIEAAEGLMMSSANEELEPGKRLKEIEEMMRE